MTTQLKPCPHCGQVHLARCVQDDDLLGRGDAHWIHCPRCEMHGPEAATEEEAAAAWNTLPRPSDVAVLKARAEAAEACAQKHLRDLTALREYLELNAQEGPDVDECLANSDAMHPDDWQRIGGFLKRQDELRVGPVRAERDRLAARVADLEALTGPQRDRLVELERDLEAAKLAACDGTPCSIFTEDHLIFSARRALARTAPAADPETGAPVSLGWRIRWLCDRVSALEAASKERGEKLVIAFQNLARECYHDGLRAAGIDGSVVGRRMSEALTSLGFEGVADAG